MNSWWRAGRSVVIGVCIAVVFLTVSNCSRPSPSPATVTVTDDGADDRDRTPQTLPSDLNQIPDAIPRNEPRSAIGNQPYTALGKRYHPLASAKNFVQRGVASWYGEKFHGRRTSGGEPYDMFAMTAAHPTLPLPTYVRVTDLDTRRAVVVKVNDRGPFLHDRIIDLSFAAAHKLGITARGTGRVEVRAIVPDGAETVAPVFIQVGAFGAQDGARALRQRLQRAGFALAANDTRGDLHRVRVGPFASQADAAAARVRLEALLGRTVLFVSQ